MIYPYYIYSQPLTPEIRASRIRKNSPFVPQNLFRESENPFSTEQCLGLDLYILQLQDLVSWLVVDFKINNPSISSQMICHFSIFPFLKKLDLFILKNNFWM